MMLEQRDSIVSTVATEKQAPIILTREAVIPSKTDSQASPQEQKAFFPWLEPDEENVKLSMKIVKRFPVLGAVGLIGSVLTVFLSWLVLFLFNGHRTITHEYHHLMPKPAAWLSVILSINGILVHMAVSQGMAVSWWYQASKKQTTVGDLHNVWATGSSIVSALTEWRGFNYIALATVFVATLPANGILLQNAMGTVNGRVAINSVERTFGVSDHVPVGFSGLLNSDGTVQSYGKYWQEGSYSFSCQKYLILRIMLGAFMSPLILHIEAQSLTPKFAVIPRIIGANSQGNYKVDPITKDDHLVGGALANTSCLG
jgi:hypothetical protein